MSQSSSSISGGSGSDLDRPMAISLYEYNTECPVSLQ